MKSSHKLPADAPAHGCGRCLWWQQSTPDGWGMCLLKHHPQWYKCMVCDEYEYDPEQRSEQ